MSTDSEIRWGEGIPNLHTLQSSVGGYIESAPTKLPLTIFCDEEGKLKRKPVNRLATLICDDLIVGDIIICGPPDGQGELTALDTRLATSLVSVLQSFKEILP